MHVNEPVALVLLVHEQHSSIEHPCNSWAYLGAFAQFGNDIICGQNDIYFQHTGAVKAPKHKR